MKRFFFFITVLTGCLFLAGNHSSAGEGCATAQCHASFQQGQKTHPVDSKCLNCHLGDPDGHPENKEKFSLAPEMCIICHKDVVDHQYLHPPAASHDCHLCHKAHGEKKNRLLPEEYSAKLFLPYGEDEYRLCFSCHKRDLLLFPDTSFSTGFRNGQRNLHYLHVNKANRGRNCKLCHDMHGSELPKLIVKTVDFGKWQMDLNFEKTENGGRCLPGCHRLERYSREFSAGSEIQEKDNGH